MQVLWTVHGPAMQMPHKNLKKKKPSLQCQSCFCCVSSVLAGFTCVGQTQGSVPSTLSAVLVICRTWKGPFHFSFKGSRFQVFTYTKSPGWYNLSLIFTTSLVLFVWQGKASAYPENVPTNTRRYLYPFCLGNSEKPICQ